MSAASPARVPGTPRVRLAPAVLVVLLLAFAGTRAALYWTVAPILDADTFKYLGGADSLWAGNGWPPVFVDKHEGGGALHAMPGYTWFLLAVWSVFGRPVLCEVVLVQGLLSFAALLATVDLVRRWHGDVAAVAVAALITASPSLAFLDHMVMPEAAGGALFAIAMWFAAKPGTGTGLAPLRNPYLSRVFARFFAATVAGVLVGSGVLLRTSAQVFVPFPLLLAAFRLRRGRSLALWAVAYLAGFAAPLLPWMAHNHAVHGHRVLTASTGRNLYFTGVWSDTIDRDTQMHKFRPGQETDVNSSYDLLDLQFQAFLDSGMDIAAADAAMQKLALEEYRAAGLGRYVEGRAATLAGLFADAAFGRENMALRTHLAWYLDGGFSRERTRSMMEKRWSHELTPQVVRVIDDAQASRPGPHLWLRWWAYRLRFENLPLAGAFAAAAGVLLATARSSAPALVCWAAPVCAYLAMFTIFGAPLYRYQATIHAPMLAVIGIAIAEGVRAVRSKRPAVATG